MHRRFLPIKTIISDYIDETLVYLTLEKGEIESEYWFDCGTRLKDDLKDLDDKVDLTPQKGTR